MGELRISFAKKRLTNNQAVDPIRRLFEDLSQPSEPRLKHDLKARGIVFTNEKLSSIVKGSAYRQIFAPRQRYVGKVTSTAPTLRWAADMVFMTSSQSKNGQKIILVVQDIFSRRIYTVALAKNTPEGVITTFRIILKEAKVDPTELNTDMDASFTTGPSP